MAAMHEHGRLEGTDYKVIVISIVLLVLSVVGLGVSEEFVPFWSRVTSSVSSVVLSIALVSLVYEWLLRKTVTTQLLALVGIEKSLSAAGLQHLTDERELNWSELLTGGARFHILLIDPTVWVGREWRRVLDEARERAVRVTILLPNPDGSVLEKISERLHFSKEDFTGRLLSSQRTIEETWKQQALSEQTVLGSELKIIYYDNFPCYELIRCNDRRIIILGAAVRGREGQSGMAIVFAGPKASYPSHLFDDEIGSLQEDAAAYHNRVE